MGAEYETLIRMPRYKCHKEVWALKIREVRTVTLNGQPMTEIVPEDDKYATFLVGSEYVKKHEPYSGGYYVVYDDGYTSFSPAEAFENGYTRL